MVSEVPAGGQDGTTAPVSRFAATVRRAPYRAVFISDLHLGAPGCQGEALLDFLDRHPSEYLYLVGDIVDGAQLQSQGYLPQSHNDVVQKIVRKARKGCKVVFLPGSHDPFARPFAARHFGDIAVQDDAVHVTATGKRLWIVHGDTVDAVVRYPRWLAVVGDTLHRVTVQLDRQLNRWRGHVGLPSRSFSAQLAYDTHSAVHPVGDFEAAAAAEAGRRGHDGVVCGHTHRAAMRTIAGTLYCNAGDWVGSRSALLEHTDGRLELRHWRTSPKLHGWGAVSPLAA